MRIDNIPKKPGLPLILKLALIMWGTSALVYANGKILLEQKWLNENLPLFLAILLCIIIFIVILLLWKKKHAFVCLSIIVLSISLATSLIASSNLINNTKNLQKIGNGIYNFEVLEDQKLGTYYNTCEANIINTVYKVKLQLPQDFEEVHAGDIIKANVKFSAAADTQVSTYWQNALCANARANNAEKLSRADPFGLIYLYRNHLIQTIRDYDWQNGEGTSQAEQLLNAIICGQRIDLNSGELYDSFKIDGLAHLVAVSGAHLSLVTAILLILLKKLRLKKWLIIFIQSVFILAYLICAAIPISALRAAFMAYIALFAFFGKRRPAPLNALGLCIIILIALDASTSVSVSFALSAGSTLGIILFSGLFEYWIAKPFPKCPEWVRSAVALTFAANVCSQPLSISIFNQFPIIAPISNIICTPIFTLLCGGGLIASVFCSIFTGLLPWLSKGIMFLAYCVSQIMCFVTQTLSKIPFASIPATINIYIAIGLTLSLCLILYLCWPKETKVKRFKIPKTFKWGLAVSSVVVVLVFVFITPNFGATQLVMLDVGQGDSILLKSKGKVFMVDTGNQDSMLKSRLAEQGIAHLDGVLITHPDDDHCGSLDVIEQLVDVSKVYVAKDLPTCDDTNCKKLMSQISKVVSNDRVEKLKVGDKINFGEIELNIIWPDAYKDNGGNADSLCCMASIDLGNDGEIESRVLLCGDAEKDEISTMINKRRIPRLDIYKCGHHGSANALETKSAKTLSPKITLISVGAKNRYGHPNAKTIEILEALGSRIYRTDKNGTITCSFCGNTIDIKTDK